VAIFPTACLKLFSRSFGLTDCASHCQSHKVVLLKFTLNQTNLWAATYQNILQNHPDPTEVRFWLDALQWDKAQRMGPGKVKVCLSAPNNYYANFITSAYRTEIERAVTQVLGESCEVVIEALDNKADSEKFEDGHQDETPAPPNPFAGEILDNLLAPPSASDAAAHAASARPMPSARGSFKPARDASRDSSRVISDNIDTHLIFDNYIVGPSNQFAYASAFSTAEKPVVQFNPLFIYGPPAVGKTHLLHAIGNHIKARNPHIRAYFVSAENFVNEFIESIQHKNPGDFRAKYRENVDLLLIDDVQFIVGKDRSEEEFIHTFNTLHSLKKMIVLTSDKAPKDIDGLEERIRTRFEMGLVADIRAPEIETRIAILKAKAESDDIYLPDEVATFLGMYVKDTVRNLHGALVKLQQYASLTGSEITLDLAKQVLHNSIPEEGQEYTVEMILNAACKHYGIKMKDLKGTSRAKNFSLPRQVAMFLIRRYTNLGYREIGQIFGKDHSTAVHAHQKIEAEIEIDMDLKRNIEQVREQL
jgi:chromosomal replication initiator protein